MRIPRIRSRRDAVVAARKAKWKAWDLLHGNRYPPDLVFWRPNDGRRNFGDELSPLVVRYMLAKKGIDWRTKPSARLLAIGSIMHLAENRDVIWGSGVHFNFPPDWANLRDLDVRSVRGPLSRHILRAHGIDCPEEFGDPGLVLSKLFPCDRSSRIPYIIIPNLKDFSLFRAETNLVSPLLPVKNLIKIICQAQLVIASSLHAIVLAETYGIKAQLVLPPGHRDSIQKYEDYYLGTGRQHFQVARSVKEALDFGGLTHLDIDVNRIQERFPYDLYT